MSEPSAFGFGQFVPGFDFLQNLSKTASAAQPTGTPGLGSWVAPTLSVEDIDKRIQELKSVLFWLEQNTTALKATIQAMEVQKMTLTTLESMNVSMADLAKAFTARPPVTTPEAAGPAAADASTTAASTHPGSPPKTSLFTPKPEASGPSAPAPEAQAKAQASSHQPADEPTQGHPKAAVDPMQWWGALTQQFQGIAAAALQDVAGEAMKAGVKTPSTRASKARKPSTAQKSAGARPAAKASKTPSARSKTGQSAGRKTPPK